MNKNIADSFWKNKKILITGYNGFKGSWMCLMLKLLNAKIYGYSLNNKENKRNEKIFKLDSLLTKKTYGDVRDYKKLKKFIGFVKPEIIIHLAAQSIVIESYKYPKLTFETNFNGLLNLLEITKSKKNIFHLIVTSDKCYENKYFKKLKEQDPLGGEDPYSASKATAEILANSYRSSFDMKITTARGGNVIGGGDWNKNRIIPDIIKAMFSKKNFYFRNPKQTRPWQHVIEVNYNYLQLIRLYFLKKVDLGAWNIGPRNSFVNSKLVNFFYTKKKFKIKKVREKFSEKKFLNLNTFKAKKHGIFNIWTFKKSLEETYNWYYIFFNNKNKILEFSKNQIINYFNDRKN